MKKLIQLSLLGAFATLQLVASDTKTETVKDNVKVEKVKVDSIKIKSKFGEPDFENSNDKSKLKKYKLTEKW